MHSGVWNSDRQEPDQSCLGAPPIQTTEPQTPPKLGGTGAETVPLEAGALEVIAKLDCSLPEGEAATLSNEKAGESSCLSMDKGVGDDKLDANSSADSSSPLIQ